MAVISWRHVWRKAVMACDPWTCKRGGHGGHYYICEAVKHAIRGEIKRQMKKGGLSV